MAPTHCECEKRKGIMLKQNQPINIAPNSHLGCYSNGGNNNTLIEGDKNAAAGIDVVGGNNTPQFTLQEGNPRYGRIRERRNIIMAFARSVGYRVSRGLNFLLTVMEKGERKSHYLQNCLAFIVALAQRQIHNSFFFSFWL